MADPGEADARRVIAARFARTLIAARKAAGYSQEALGFEASLHRTEIGTLERGERIPKLDTLVKLATVLGISVERLVEGIEWRPPDRAGGRFAAAPSKTRSSSTQQTQIQDSNASSS